MTTPGTAVTDRYRIERELGAGGMATVYLAHDVRHDRKVALKVLRPELAAVIGGARFLAEIRTTANLQHPHILPLYDSGETDHSVFYVMPYVTGESLRDRLNREKQLPVDDALRIACDVADALDYAHRQGVVHRDIKPENILLHDGRPMVADFGIALAVSRSDSSTRMTETGMSLGTPHYMSPEQAMGEREVTARSDVYALGCVLYEMLTGEPPFTGPTAQAIVARVMTDAPRSISAQRHTVPTHVEAVVRRALEKLPADRFATAAQFADALRGPAVARTLTYPVASPPAAAPGRWLVWALGAFALLATVAAAWGWSRRPPADPVSRYALHFSGGSTPVGMMHLSRDGNLLVYGGPIGQATMQAALNSSTDQLWMKARDQADPVPIPNSTGIGVFALSPDARAIAFVEAVQPGTPGPLRRLSVAGGPSVTVADSAVPFGVAWLENGEIVYAKVAPGGYGLWRVGENGGAATRLWEPDSTGALALPYPLPGGRAVLVTRYGSVGPPSVWLVDTRSGNATRIIEGALAAQYSPSGHLLYARGDGALLALPFDLGAMEVRGTPMPVMDEVEITFGLLPQFTIALDGTLVLRTGIAGHLSEYQPVWVDRSGRHTPIDTGWSANIFTTAANVGWALSPDDTRLALGAKVNGNDDIWVKELPTGPATRITRDSASDIRPRWSADGRRITFVSARAGFNQQLLQTNADGSGNNSVLLALPAPILEGLWSRDGTWLLARIGDETTRSRDIVAIRPGRDSAPVPILATEAYNEAAIALSPDAKWLAYESTEAGNAEIFLRPFPDADSGKWQVSTSGGFAPLWSRDGRELFYVSPRREMMAVAVTAGSPPRLGERRVLFRIPNDMYGGTPEYYTAHDVARDGRFLMMRRVRDDSLSTRVLVVENFSQELRRRTRSR